MLERIPRPRFLVAGEVVVTDQLTRLAWDAETLRRMGEAGRARIARGFSVEQMVDAYARLYEELA